MRAKWLQTELILFYPGSGVLILHATCVKMVMVLHDTFSVHPPPPECDQAYTPTHKCSVYVCLNNSRNDKYLPLKQCPTLQHYKHTHPHFKQEMRCTLQFRWRGVQSTGTYFELVRREQPDIRAAGGILFQGQNAEITCWYHCSLCGSKAGTKVWKLQLPRMFLLSCVWVRELPKGPPATRGASQPQFTKNSPLTSSSCLWCLMQYEQKD